MFTTYTGGVMSGYGFIKTLDCTVEEAEVKVTEALKKEGFGILTRIDMKEKFKEKLGIDFKKYIILGACNPPLALKSVSAEENIGLLLPCNVIVYEKEGKAVVGVIKPSSAMGMIRNDALQETAGIVEDKLQRVIEAL